jgi:hypothetical protein
MGRSLPARQYVPTREACRITDSRGPRTRQTRNTAPFVDVVRANVFLAGALLAPGCTRISSGTRDSTTPDPSRWPSRAAETQCHGIAVGIRHIEIAVIHR